nr:MAG TPA: hypothetical protein [Microviridae sp.]
MAVFGFNRERARAFGFFAHAQPSAARRFFLL